MDETFTTPNTEESPTVPAIACFRLARNESRIAPSFSGPREHAHQPRRCALATISAHASASFVHSFHC
jgi:hypothetical protein